ncbi:sigma-54-dependent transcriptional regulator [Desulfosediminicola sp.]|uniref:sigma-54-dependent transcriptional regulator n=1 Tax=Desulfosediminicola sp. TaxID=2886825 RepID=UPI003AF24D4E
MSNTNGSGMGYKLLIIDDEENMRHMLQSLLSRSGYQIFQAQDGREALEKVQQEHFDFALCDIRMPVLSGMEFLQQGRKFLKDTTVIMMSAYGTVELALEAMKKGAYDYISKPFKVDEVLLTLKKAEEREQLKRENLQLREELTSIRAEDGFFGMVGDSEVMRELFNLAKKVAGHDATVLITGESGTGKELLARGIHKYSNRSRNEFFAINCGSIPENLLEAELFGYEKGAFTGAESKKNGLILEADGSSLFLDEIAELPYAMQVKLLRVLQEGEIRPIGANHPLSVDVRIIAATSRNLEKEIADNRFREDLYYRLNVIRLELPPLRERKSDIHKLCDHLIRKKSNYIGREIEGMSAGAGSLLLHHDWPGNVRELENVIERAVILAETNSITEAELPDALRPGSQEVSVTTAHGESFSLKSAKKEVEMIYIRRVLEKTGGNKRKAAELLEMSYPSLLSKIKEYGF